MPGDAASRPLDGRCGPVDEVHPSRFEALADDRGGDARAAADLEDAIRSVDGEGLHRPADPLGDRSAQGYAVTPRATSRASPSAS
jgi:hypothetical protein